MATHSSVLAWRIPGMGEPGGLPSMGSHRVGHNWSDLAAAAAESYISFRNKLIFLLLKPDKDRPTKTDLSLLWPRVACRVPCRSPSCPSWWDPALRVQEEKLRLCIGSCIASQGHVCSPGPEPSLGLSLHPCSATGWIHTIFPVRAERNEYVTLTCAWLCYLEAKIFSQFSLSCFTVQFTSVQSLSPVLFSTPWIPALQASLSITNS